MIIIIIIIIIIIVMIIIIRKCLTYRHTQHILFMVI